LSSRFWALTFDPALGLTNFRSPLNRLVGEMNKVLSAVTSYLVELMPASPDVANTDESVSNTFASKASYTFGSTFTITYSPSLSVLTVKVLPLQPPKY